MPSGRLQQQFIRLWQCCEGQSQETTLNELAAALGNDPSFATTIATEIANRVRFDAAQTLTGPQQTQARSNIGAAAASDVSGLLTGLGTYDRDYAADYTAAKA